MNSLMPSSLLLPELEREADKLGQYLSEVLPSISALSTFLAEQKHQLQSQLEASAKQLASLFEQNGSLPCNMPSLTHFFQQDFIDSLPKWQQLLLSQQLQAFQLTLSVKKLFAEHREKWLTRSRKPGLQDQPQVRRAALQLKKAIWQRVQGCAFHLQRVCQECVDLSVRLQEQRVSSQSPY